MSRKLSVAVVGLGVGKEHLAAYARLPDLYRIKAVCDLDAARAAAIAAEFGAPVATAQFAELIAMRDLDVIDICTPPGTHRTLAEQALRAGFHVVCEKPLVGSLRDADALISVAETSPGTLFPIFQYRFGNGLQKLKFLQARGLTGRSYLSTIETSWRRPAEYYAVPWRGKWATELGGCCLSQAIHAHDILSFINGPVKSVSARLTTRVNAIEVEDCGAIAIEMADGSVAALALTLGSAEELSRLRFTFENLTAENRGTEPYKPGKDPWYIKGSNEDADRRIAAALRDFERSAESFEGQFTHIHAAIVDGAPTPVTLGEARASLELITAIYHSAETGTVVTLPIGSDHPKYGGWVPERRRFG